MKTLVFGAGAVGLGIASCLLAGGAQVDLIARRHTAAALQREGFSRTGIFGSVTFSPDRFGVYQSAAALTDRDFDYVLVCTKSFDTESVADQIAASLGDHLEVGPLFVLFQNGWGNAETASKFLPPERIYNARVITGFTRTGDATVEVTVHADAIRIGSLFGGDADKADLLCRTISAGGIPAETTEHIGKDLWAKLLYNCPLNSLGALFGATYGELADDPHTRAVMNAIIEEAFTVMSASGYETHWPSVEAYIDAFYGVLVPPTRDHYPSTLQDLRAGKRTEIDAINGAVVALASRAMMQAPVNAAVLQMIKFRETRRLHV